MLSSYLVAKRLLVRNRQLLLLLLRLRVHRHKSRLAGCRTDNPKPRGNEYGKWMIEHQGTTTCCLFEQCAHRLTYPDLELAAACSPSSVIVNDSRKLSDCVIITVQARHRTYPSPSALAFTFNRLCCRHCCYC